MQELSTPMETPMSSFSLGSGAEGAASSEVIQKEGGNIEQRVADLEMRPRMPAAGTGIDGNALVLDGPSPRWGDGSGLPDGVRDGDMLVWDDVADEWIVYDNALQIMRWWDGSTNEWKEVEVSADDGKVLQTASPDGLKFDYLAWR